MKLYHGTSFENACKILSAPLWHPALLDAEQVKFMQANGQMEIPVRRIVSSSVTFFTTSIQRASGYAKLNDRPVVLIYEHIGLTHSGDAVFGFNDPIPTNQVKALIGVNAKIMAYGTLVNAIYQKNVNDYTILSACGGLLHAKNPTQMIRFLESIIKDIKDIKNNKL